MNIFNKGLLKTLKNIIFISLPTLILIFFILELFFRFIIIASDPPRSHYYENDKIYAYDSKRNDGTYSDGKFTQIKTHWHINNFGWNNPINYVAGKDSGLIAVIGDSYIEAFQVDVDKNYPSLLRKKVYPENEVYSFGVSGAPLSQYLHMSRYVKKYFNPDILIFNIIHNDFDESISEFNPSKKYFLQLSYNDSTKSFTEKEPQADFSRAQYRPFWQTLIYKSAFVRYLYLNLKVNNISKKYNNNQSFEANKDVDELKERETIIKKSTEYIVGKIRNENFEKRIIFIFDAPRNAIYSNTLAKSNVYFLNNMMKEICKNNNIEYIDLTEPMKNDFQLNKKKFNSEIDEHWNEYGHEFVAQYLYNYLQKTKIIKE